MPDDMDNDIEHARTVLGTLPMFSGHDLAAMAIKRLGGLTNLVYRVETGGKSFCLRLPGDGTEEYINRKVEAQIAAAAARAGVSPQVLHSDPDTGIMVMEFLGGVTMSPTLFKSTPGAPDRAGAAFAKLHTSGETFDFRFELFAMIDEYLGILSGKDVVFPEGYHEVVKDAEAVRAALEAHPASLAPCHCDPLCENFLDTGEVMWIIDWEYSGMNDPMWDLGDLSVEGEFSAEQDTEMLTAYFGRPPTAAEAGRVVIYKAMCDLLWTLWGLIQHANNNPAEDFWAYSVGRFERCKALMSTPQFKTHLTVLG